MKKLLTFLTLLTLFFTTAWAVEVNGYISFGSASGSTKINSPTVNGNDDLGNSWTITTVGTTSFTQSSAYSQVGSSSAPATSITFSTTLPQSVNITSMEAKFGGNSGTAGDITLKVGDTSIGTGSLNATNDVIVTSSTTATGQVLTVTVTNIAKGVKCYYIAYTYEDGGTPATKYNVNIGNMANGRITANPTSAAEGTTINLTVTPNTGYTLNTLTVTGDESSDNITVTNNKFTMPAEDVTVNATFSEIPSVTYNRINDKSDLTDGATYILVYENTSYVNGSLNSSKYLNAESGNDITINKNDGIAEISNPYVAPFIIRNVGTAEAPKYIIQLNGDPTTLLGLSGASNNSMVTYTDATDIGAKWSIEFSGNNATITNDDRSDCPIKFNASSPRFSNYASSGSAIQLYKKVETGDLTVTCDNDNIEHGSITASPATANANATITITATPEDGYELSTVTVTCEDATVTAPTATVNGNTATFTMPASDVTVTATFDLAWNAITYTCSPTTGGDVWVNPSDDPGFETSSGTTKTQMGTSVTFKVVPANGFNISSVTATDASGATVNLTEGETNSSHGGWGTYYTFTMPAYAVSITATFTEGNLFIIGEANDNGWDGNTGVQMTYDTQNKVFTKDVFFSAADYGFFSFADALSGQQGSWANMGRRYGAPSGDYDILNEDNPATWDSGQQDNAFKVPAGIYTITVNKALGQVTVTPKTVTVTLDKAAGTLEAGTTVNVVSNLNTLLQGCKSDITGTLAYSKDNGDTFTEGNSFVVNEDLTAKGKAYYGKIEEESDAYAYTVVTHYAVTCTANPTKGGTVSVSPTSAIAGETVTITANPKNGYDLTSITVNGDEITLVEGQTEYTFEMPAQATEVIATFTAKTLNITVNNDNSKGTVYGIPATSTVGSPISFSVTPKDGYTVNTVTYSFTPNGGTENTTTLTEPYSFNMPGYDVTINITYTEQSSGSGGEATDLYHESFGNNPNSARDWDDEYSVKTGVADVYSGITGYTVSNVKQGKNTTGYVLSGLNQSTKDVDASIIIGPLSVANYTDLVLSYYWKAASINGTYVTSLSYATSENGTYTEVEGTGSGATSYVKRTYNLPEAAQVSTLYLKIVFNTSNTQAIIDEVNLSGVPNGVQEPVFTPEQGTYGIDVDVTISCPTSGATIYYTDDNSDPKTSNTRKTYTGEILVSSTTTFKAYAEKDGLSSDVVTATYTIDKNTEIETVSLDYSEPFTGSDGIGKFTIDNVSGFSPVWSLDGNYGVKGTSYSNGTNYAATSRLSSPIIDLTAATLPELTFSHQINSYFNDPSTQCTVWIRETADGTSGTWVQLPVTVTVPASGSWSNDFARVDLSDYIDKTVQISFLYTNPTEGSGAGTWEIQNFKVTDNTDIVVVNNIAEFMNKDKVDQGEVAKFRNPVVVLYHYQQYFNDEHGDYANDYIWIKDNSGYAIIYGHYLDVEYKNGDVIPAGFTATKNHYPTGDFDQLYEPEGLQPATEKALADPEAVTLNLLNSNKESYNGHYVTISKMQIQFSQGELVAYTTSSDGQRTFSVGDETVAINDNQAGASGSIIGYNNFDNPWLKTLDYPEFEDNSTVYGDFNITGIFEKYNNKWEFMPIIITPWEADKLTLHDLCEKGEDNKPYTISNNLMCVYAKGNSIWVKDDTGQSIWMTSPAEGDNILEINAPGNTRLDQTYYDQSNWCEIHLANLPEGVTANSFKNKIIKGGTISGIYKYTTNDPNPTLENVKLTLDDISSESNYAPNYYMAANFYGSQPCTGEANHGNFFFMNPKPQEFAHVVWVYYDGDSQMMVMPTGSHSSQNTHNFLGSFKVNMSLNENQDYTLVHGSGYGDFEAIIRLQKPTSKGAPEGTEYVVYPLNISKGTVTGINTVNVNGSEVKSVKYVNVAGIVSDRPFQGVNIVVTEYTDGSRTTSKMLKK